VAASGAELAATGEEVAAALGAVEVVGGKGALGDIMVYSVIVETRGVIVVVMVTMLSLEHAELYEDGEPEQALEQ